MSSINTRGLLTPLVISWGLLVIQPAALGQTTSRVSTTINGAQVKVPTVTSTDRLQSIIVMGADGRLMQALLGSGIVLDRATTPPTLRIQVPAAAQTREIVSEVVTFSTTAQQSPNEHLVYALRYVPVAGTLKLYRDGVRVIETVDYMLEGAEITFIDHYRGMGDALVVADYKTQQ